VTSRDPSDPRANFEDLYRSTRDGLLRYLVRRCSDAEEAADLLAETYLTAWRKLDIVPEGENAQLWLYGVARNLLLRSARRRRVADRLVERLADGLRAADRDQPGSDAHSHALRRALSALPEHDREILTLTAWEGLAPREIAAVMSISANIVRIRLHRARTRVKKQLDRPHDLLPRAVVQAREQSAG
jgi:RNA polymerase sigma factor (sigma-70 family)